MAVDVETRSLLRPSTSVVAQAVPRPVRPVRQAAGRYLPFPLDLRMYLAKSSL